MTAVLKYINESIEELRHVRWPTRNQAVRFSAVVIAVSAVCAVAFGLVDLGLSQLLQFLLSLSLNA